MQLKYLFPEPEIETPVALVGSSGSLITQPSGHLIDQYPTVIRFNSAPTEGFEHEVGSKTTFRALNNTCFIKGYAKTLHNSKLIIVRPRGFWKQRFTLSNPDNEFYKLKYEKAFIKHFPTKSDKQINTGNLVVVLCLANNITPHLFGFDLDEIPRTHYWETTSPDSCVVHDPTAERRALRKLKNKGLIKVQTQ